MKKYLFFTILFGLILFSAPAYANAASLSLSSTSNTYNVGDVFDVNIILNTQGQPAQGVDIRYLNYDASFLELQDADLQSSGVQIKAGSLMPNTTANSVSGGKVLFSQATSGSQVYNGSGTLATMKFKVLKAGSTQMNFDFTAGSSIDANVASNGSDILTSVSGKSFTLSNQPQPTETGTVKMYLTPGSATYGVGDSFSVNVILDTNGQAADAVDMVLRYNNRVLQVLDSDENKDGVQIQNGNILNNVQVNDVNVARSTINFSKTTGQSSGYSGRGVLATINFKAVGTGRAYVSFYFRRNYSGDSNIVSGGVDILKEVTNGIYNIDHDNLPLMVYGGSPRGSVFANRYQSVSVETNKKARCRYSETPGLSYDLMRRSLRTRNGVDHSLFIRVEEAGSLRSIFVRCQDRSRKYTSSADYPISFKVVDPPVFVVQTEGSLRNYIDIDILSAGSSNSVYSFSARANRYGKVWLPRDAALKPGTYDIVLSSKNSLKRKASNVLLAGGSEVVLPKLIAGDLNGDGVVNSLDWSLVNARWFKRDYTYDINGDRIINSIEWGLIKKNWLLRGDI